MTNASVLFEKKPPLVTTLTRTKQTTIFHETNWWKFRIYSFGIGCWIPWSKCILSDINHDIQFQMSTITTMTQTHIFWYRPKLWKSTVGLHSHWFSNVFSSKVLISIPQRVQNCTTTHVDVVRYSIEKEEV
jgi:hypothetical protein